MRIRRLTPEDRPALAAWLFKAHGAMIDAGVFYQNNRRGLVIEDDRGPVLYALETDVVRTDIQFDPFEVNPFRTGKALKMLDQYTTESHPTVREIIFNSVATPLISFMQRLGFVQAGDVYLKKIHEEE